MKPSIEENFADNGEHSHWSVIDSDTGEVLIDDVESVMERLKKIEGKPYVRSMFTSMHGSRDDEYVTIYLSNGTKIKAFSYELGGAYMKIMETPKVCEDKNKPRTGAKGEVDYESDRIKK